MTPTGLLSEPRAPNDSAIACELNPKPAKARATLDYRGPIDAAKLALTKAIQRREHAYQGAAWSMLAAGLPALLVGPLLVASVVASTEERFRSRHPFGWWPVFTIAASVLIPLMFWFERRTRGEWYNDEVRGQGTSISDLSQCSSSGEWRLRTTAATWAGIFELMLWGPRMCMAAASRWRTRVPPAVLIDAAAIVAYLRHFEGGVGTHELPTLRPIEVLRYLVERDWVGVSKAGDRVWLLTDARRALPR